MGKTRWWVGLTVSLLAVGYFGKEHFIPQTSKRPAIFINLESGQPSSIDPLLCDFSNNAYLASFIHSPLLEVAPDNSFTSAFFSDISYRPDGLAILKLKPGTRFSDGSPVHPEDLLLAISRMLKNNPEFPAIKAIAGRDEWLASGASLKTGPSGLGIHGDEIHIQFKGKPSNPLFRLSLSLFAVIPAHCIDLASSKITCEHLPTAGRYFLPEPFASSPKLELRRNPNFSGLAQPMPDQITYQSGMSPEFDHWLTDANVVIANQTLFLSEDLKSKLDIGMLHSLEMPYNRFFGMLMNPHVKPFDDARCRVEFLHTLRQHIAALRPDLDVSPSLLPRMLPGFMKASEFTTLALSDREHCRELLSHGKFKWASLAFKGLEFLNAAVVATAEELNFKLELQTFATTAGQDKAFIEGDLAFRFTGSGFWALDPVGDIQMLFTPGLHFPFKHVWSNREYLKLVEDVGSDPDVPAALRRLNAGNDKMGLFGILLHSGRLLLANRDVDPGHSASVYASSSQPWLYFQ